MKEKKMDRRDFLIRAGRVGAGVTAACGLGLWLHSRSQHPGRELSGSQVRNYSVDIGADLPRMAVVSGGARDALAAAALAALGGMGKFVSRGEVVVLKPNIG